MADAGATDCVCGITRQHGGLLLLSHNVCDIGGAIETVQLDVDDRTNRLMFMQVGS